AKQRGNLGGSFTITAVGAGERWVGECPLLFGEVVFDPALEAVAKNRVRVVKRGEAGGRIAPVGRVVIPNRRRGIAEALAARGRLAAAEPPGLVSREYPAAARPNRCWPRPASARGRQLSVPEDHPGRRQGRRPARPETPDGCDMFARIVDRRENSWWYRSLAARPPRSLEHCWCSPRGTAPSAR